MVATISNSYTLSFLARYPLTRDIVRKRLEYLGREPASVHDTLANMCDTNMGGGIPYEVITALISELDRLELPLE